MIKKRETFYLSGYDPRGARYYYGLYKKELALQEKVNGINMVLSSRARTKEYMQSWSITSTSEEKLTKTNYHFLEWDDIIRENWSKGFLTILLDLIFYLKVYIFSGRFIKYMRISPRQMFGIFFPIIYFSFSAFLSFAISTTIVDILHIDFLILSQLLMLIISVLLFYLLILFAEKLSLLWMLRIFVFTAGYDMKKGKKLEKRVEILTSYIVNTIKKSKENDIDEILIVAHSVGPILLMSILEKILKETAYSFKNVSILTLGEGIPLVSSVDRSKILKKQMEYISKQEDIYWLDYTSVIDLFCFPSLNYFNDIGIDIKRKEKFHFLSARFHTLYFKSRYNKIRKNILLAHFLYLMSTDKVGGYDFFKMTAGHERLSFFLNKRNNK